MPELIAFSMPRQDQTNWCWAAVTSAVVGYFKGSPGPPQCGLANMSRNQTTCCEDGATPQCNRSAETGAILRAMGVLREQVERSISLHQVEEELKANRPIACRIEWEGVGVGHVFVIHGVFGTLLRVTDPDLGADGAELVEFNVFSGSYRGKGKWTRTWLLRSPS